MQKIRDGRGGNRENGDAANIRVKLKKNGYPLSRAEAPETTAWTVIPTLSVSTKRTPIPSFVQYGEITGRGRAMAR